ncbi:MAG TPA: MBL fold metallo-hydrolase [Vicinamibacteria bacterium]
MTLTFHGGAGTVTGSRFLLDVGRRRLLVDAGLFQGLKELRLLNWQVPGFDPGSIDHLLLTHAHIDHSGYIPRLVKETTLVFSGDVGRYGVPLHSDPTAPPACDFMVMESTYGDRRHDRVSLERQLSEPIRKTFDRRGTVLIPSFAVGRAQLVTLILRDLMDRGDLTEVPIHIDSPMAVDATRIYGHHLKDESLDDDLDDDGRKRLFPRQVQFHQTVEQSKALNELPGPRIIISASGMLTAGRVLHHLRRLLPEDRNLVLLVGYQAAGTRGRALLEGAKSLKVHGQQVPVRAHFHAIHGLSAHADSDELLRWLRASPTPPRKVFITHGEPEASQALARRIEKETPSHCVVPHLRDPFDLDAL